MLDILGSFASIASFLGFNQKKSGEIEVSNGGYVSVGSNNGIVSGRDTHVHNHAVDIDELSESEKKLIYALKPNLGCVIHKSLSYIGLALNSEIAPGRFCEDEKFEGAIWQSVLSQLLDKGYIFSSGDVFYLTEQGRKA